MRKEKVIFSVIASLMLLLVCVPAQAVTVYLPTGMEKIPGVKAVTSTSTGCTFLAVADRNSPYAPAYDKNKEDVYVLVRVNQKASNPEVILSGAHLYAAKRGIKMHNSWLSVDLQHRSDIKKIKTKIDKAKKENRGYFVVFATDTKRGQVILK